MQLNANQTGGWLLFRFRRNTVRFRLCLSVNLKPTRALIRIMSSTARVWKRVFFYGFFGVLKSQFPIRPFLSCTCVLQNTVFCRTIPPRRTSSRRIIWIIDPFYNGIFVRFFPLPPKRTVGHSRFAVCAACTNTKANVRTTNRTPVYSFASQLCFHFFPRRIFYVTDKRRFRLAQTVGRCSPTFAHRPITVTIFFF